MMKAVCPRTCGYCKYDDLNNGCHEAKPAYCARHQKLCKDKKFKDMMRKVCPRTCGYCKFDEINDGCHEAKPAYCARHQKLCKDKKFKDMMRKVCPRTCGYCKFDEINDVCKDVRGTTYCSERKNLCNNGFFREFMQENCARTCGCCKGGPTDPPRTLPHVLTTIAPLYTGKCGQPEVRGPRIVSGSTPLRGVWPWQILLMYRGFGNCGGTLIHPQWVVTAAHCVYGREKNPGSYIVRVGAYNTRVQRGSEVDVRVMKIVRHPGYGNLNNDIALLKLDFPVILDKYVQPACMPSQDPPVGSRCYMTGWGQIKHPGDMVSILQQGMLPVVTNKKCYEKNKHLIGVPITDAMICGGDDNSKTSGCHGDSGGPYVCRINGKWELHGVVSHGSGDCDAKKSYTVFARVNHFKDWIQENTATQ